MDNAIEFKNVFKSFTSQVVLENASIIIPTVGLSVFYGRSGIGKSTLFSLTAGLDMVDQGEIFLRDKLVSKKGWNLPCGERNLSMQFQGLALWPHMNVSGHLTFVTDHIDTRRLHEIIDMVGLPQEKLTAFPYELSGGECQRVAIARTIAADTDIMLFDEPFNNLDESLQVQICKVFADLSQHKSIVIIQHDTTVLASHMNVNQWYKMENSNNKATVSLVDP
ncbi:iron ABC transporter ATP-binding protein [candidate division WWE3 bacterium CG_4_9_14_3_um_filter_39_7]|uniref:Iron ABC transporter ATP-binding protein n=1 Tax=candidate division WWE3 bacterium CG_4_9_14_3_um_filter_39_7 TaxID=1975080 RepID=A0A2M7WZJ7_UNCKA|nr:MAG: iron ABC transporter ATP-binding protein [candidate division WWE3 bacterium CG_4_9_14_3_um_filter_39_7]